MARTKKIPKGGLSTKWKGGSKSAKPASNGPVPKTPSAKKGK